MNDFQKFFGFIAGANLGILKNCPGEYHGFTAVGISVLNAALYSLMSMALIMYHALDKNITLVLTVSVFYTFIIFISFWGVFSVIRKNTQYAAFLRVFAFVSIVIISLISSYSVKTYILGGYFIFNHLWLKYTAIVFIVLLSVIIHLVPIVIRMFIDCSNYEQERQRVEANFATQKEADIKAYRIKYEEYSVMFSDAKLKIEFIKHLADVTKEYHALIRNTQKETFEFLNRLTKFNTGDNTLLDECKVRVSEDFKTTLDMMSKVFAAVKE